MKLSVLVSDPDRKKERTDVNNNQKEVYVAGLARSTKEDDLHKLFSRVRALGLLHSRLAHSVNSMAKSQASGS